MQQNTKGLLLFVFLYCLKNILIDKVVDVSFFLYSSILSLVLIIFFLLTFKFNKIVRINIVLISTFSLISLYSIELFYFFNNKKFNNLNLDKTPSEKVRILKAKKNGISYDLRSRSEYIKDLKEEKIVYGNNEINFKIDSFKKKCLLEGLDDIALSLKKSDKIQSFEKNLKDRKPWIFND